MKKRDEGCDSRAAQCGQPEPHPAEEVGRDLLIPLRADDEVYVRRPPRMPRAVLEQLAPRPVLRHLSAIDA